MDNLKERVEAFLGREPDYFMGEVVLQDDCDERGAYIREWNVEGIDKPSDEVLMKIEIGELNE